MNDYELIEAAIRNGTSGGALAPVAIEIPTDFVSGAPVHATDSYGLYELSITIKNGTKVSLVEALRTIEFYEDIFSNSIHGFIDIIDMVGGLEKYVITGGERITVIILKPNSSQIIISRSDLIIHEVSKVNIDDNNSMQYRLYFMPQASITAQKKRVYKSFPRSKKISGIVNKIFKEYASESDLSVNIIEEDLKVPIEKSFLSSGFTPLEAIDFLAKRACYSGDYYIFFERMHRVRGKKNFFTSLDYLRSYWLGEVKIPEIYYQPSTTHFSNQNDYTIRATDVEIQANYNHITNMQSGFYNSRLRMIDPISRRFYDSKLNYKAIQNSTYSNKFLEDDNTFMNYDDGYPEFPGERLMIKPRHDIFGNKSRWVKNDVFLSILNTSMRINLSIPGGSNLIGAGNLIDLKLPSMQAKALNLENAVTPDDLVYAGRYYVTAVRHIIDIASYKKKIEISRDAGSLNIEAILAASSLNPPPTNVG